MTLGSQEFERTLTEALLRLLETSLDSSIRGNNQIRRRFNRCHSQKSTKGAAQHAKDELYNDT